MSNESSDKTPQGTPSYLDYVTNTGDHVEASGANAVDQVLPPSIVAPVSETAKNAAAAVADLSAQTAAAKEQLWPCYAPGDLNPQLLGKMGIMNDPSYGDDGNSMGRVGEGIRQAIRPNSLSNATTSGAIRGIVMGSYVLEASAARSMNFSTKDLATAENQRMQVLFVRVPEIHSNIPDPFCGDTVDALCRTKKALIQLHSQVGLPNALMASHALLPGSIVEIQFTNGYSKGLVSKIVSSTSHDLTLGPVPGITASRAITGGNYLSPPEPLQGPIAAPDAVKECAANYDNPPPPYSLDWNKYASKQAAAMANMHPEMIPYAKCFFWTCFVNHDIQIYTNSGYRTFEEQQILRDAYIARGRTGLPASSAGNSTHNYGLAIDFNPVVSYKLSDGSTMLHSKNHPKSEWISSGIAAAIASVPGLRWGGDFGNYDPIHIDLFNLVGPAGASDTKKMKILKARADEEGVEGNRVSLDI